MKRIILTCLLAIVAVSSLLGQIPTNGLVAWYPFNGNANDLSGNGNNGTVKGATLTTDRFGNVNSPYYFNGITSYISVNNTLANFGTRDFTILGWINLTSFYPGSNPMFAKRNLNDYSNFIKFQASSGNSKMFGEICQSSVSNYSVVSSTSSISLNNWYFVSFVIITLYKLKMMNDGVQ